jgi:tyrosine-protein phosphatase SIW14
MKAMSCVFLACRLLAFTMCLNVMPVQVSKDPTPPVDRSMGKRLLLEGVPNFAKFTPTLYRGGQPNGEGFNRLAKMGVNIVVDTGGSQRDKKLINQLGMRYVSLAWHCPFPRDEVIARFLKLIKENPDRKIFVHCRLGDDRTGMMIAAFRMSGQGWNAEQAMKEMHAFGFTTAHHLICPGLAGYEKSFPERLKESPAFRELR